MNMMTTTTKSFASRKSFYKALAKAANKFRWSVDDKGLLRGFQGHLQFCPITAVHYDRTNNFVRVYDPERCPEVRKSDRDVIVSAADDTIDDLNGAKKVARRALLRAVGLPEES